MDFRNNFLMKLRDLVFIFAEKVYIILKNQAIVVVILA